MMKTYHPSLVIQYSIMVTGGITCNQESKHVLCCCNNGIVHYYVGGGIIVFYFYFFSAIKFQSESIILNICFSPLEWLGENERYDHFEFNLRN